MRMTMGRIGALASHVRQAIVNKVGNERVDDAVVVLSAFHAGGHEFQMTQEGELMAHRRHGKPQRMGKVADTEFVVCEGVHQPKP